MTGTCFCPSERIEFERCLRSDVGTLAQDIGPRSLAQPERLEKPQAFLVRRLEEAGWTVARLASPVGTANAVNLEVEKHGTKHPEQTVVVGAHYDTAPQTPGADDNSSGVAALLVLAERFAGQPTERTLRFVAFANEEPPYFQTDLMGSRVYARRCREKGEQVVAMLCLETIGYFSDAKKSQKSLLSKTDEKWRDLKAVALGGVDFAKTRLGGRYAEARMLSKTSWGSGGVRGGVCRGWSSQRQRSL